MIKAWQAAESKGGSNETTSLLAASHMQHPSDQLASLCLSQMPDPSQTPNITPDFPTLPTSKKSVAASDHN
jgi:hypothetical protein